MDYNLFPEINPNIDEIVEKENMIDGDEVIKDDDIDYNAPKKTQKDIFLTNKKGQTNIKLEVKEPTDTETENDTVKSKKDRYAHLANARQKGIETSYINELLGHSSGNIDESRYGKGYYPDTLFNKCVKRISYQTSPKRWLDFISLKMEWDKIIL